MKTIRSAAWKAIVLCGSAMLLITACQAPADVSAGTDSENHPEEAQVNQAAVDLLPDEVKESGAVTFAGIEGMPPMMYVLQDGTTLEGVDHDILTAVGQSLDLDITIVGTKPDSFLTGMLADRFQVAAGSITVTPQRQEEVDFVSYAQYGLGLLARTEDSEEVTFEGVCGRSIGVLQGSIQQSTHLPEFSAECEAAGDPAIEESVFQDGNDLVLALTSGRIEGVLLNEVTLQDMAHKSDDALVVTDTAEQYGEDLKGIAIGKDSGLTEAVDEAMAGLHEDGTLQEIFDNWGIGEVLTEPQMNPAESEG